MAFLFSLNELLGDVALHDFVSEVPTLRVATDSINLKALLQRQTTSLETDVHEPSARKEGVGQYRKHLKESQRSILPFIVVWNLSRAASVRKIETSPRD